jgi:PAS domain S-box-containing protein
MTQNLGVAERIRERMRALGYWKHERPDVRRFCEELGYTSQYMYGWLRGRRPTLEYAKRLAVDLGVTVEWLALGQEEPGRDGAHLAKLRGHVAPVSHLIGESPGRNARAAEGDRGRPERGKVIEHPLARVGLLMERLSRLEEELQAAVRSWRASEERFRGVFENGPLGMVIFDPDTLRVVEANERFAELLRRGPDEILGAGVFDWTDPAEAATARAVVHQVVSGARPHATQESRFLTRPGTVLWAHVTWVVIRDGEGAVQYGVQMVEDITERRAAEERLQSFVAGVPIGLYRSSPAGEVLAANPALLAILGYEPGESSERISCADHYLAPEERRRSLERSARSGGISDLETQLRRRDGTVIWVRDRARAIHDGDGRIQWFEGVLEDITARRRAEEATRALAEVSRELAESLDPAKTTHTIVTRLMGLVRVRRVVLLQLDPGRSRLVCVAGVASVGDPREWIGQAVPASQGLVGRAIAEGRPIATPDLLAEPGLVVPEWARQWFQQGGHGSALAVPLDARGRTLGCLSIGDVRGRVFTDDELSLVSAFADQAALALHNARLYEDAERRRREAEVFADLARTISASLDLGTVLRQVTAGAKELCRSDRARIALPDPPGHDIRYWPDSGAGAVRSIAIEPGKGTGGHALITGRPFRTDNYCEDPRITKDYVAIAQAEGIVAEMVVPIRTGARIEGLLYVSNGTDRPFTDAEEAILMRLADHAAIAIHNARLFGEADRRRRAAESLAEIGRLLSRSLDPDDVGQRIAETVKELVGAQVAVLYRRDPASGVLRAIAFAGDPGPTGEWPSVLPKGTGVVGLAVLEGRPVTSPNPLGDPRIIYTDGARARLERLPARAVLAVPLMVSDGVVGALGLGDRIGRVFSEDEVQLAQAFAAQAAICLENARLFAERRYAAVAFASIPGFEQSGAGTRAMTTPAPPR